MLDMLRFYTAHLFLVLLCHKELLCLAPSSFFPPGMSYQVRFTVIRFENEHILITTPSAVYCKITQFSSLCQVRAFR